MSIKYSKYSQTANGSVCKIVVSHLVFALNLNGKSEKLHPQTPLESGLFYHFKL